MISKIKEHINRKYSNGYKINCLGMLSILVEALTITISFYILVVNFSSFTLLNVFMLDNKIFILSGSAVFPFYDVYFINNRNNRVQIMEN